MDPEVLRAITPALVALIVFLGGLLSALLAFNFGKLTEAHKTVLAMRSKRFEIRFTKYQERLFIGLERTHHKLTKLLDEVNDLTRPIQHQPMDQARIDIVNQKLTDLVNTYKRYIIYIPDDLGQKVSDLHDKLWSMTMRFVTGIEMSREGSGDRSVEVWQTAEANLKEARELQKEIRDRFRALVEIDVKEADITQDGIMSRIAKWWEKLTAAIR